MDCRHSRRRVVAIITGIKHFGGSANQDDTAASQRLAQREAKTEHNGWSVRSDSEDLPTSDDVEVERQAPARPGGIASSARAGLPRRRVTSPPLAATLRPTVPSPEPTPAVVPRLAPVLRRSPPRKKAAIAQRNHPGTGSPGGAPNGEDDIAGGTQLAAADINGEPNAAADAQGGGTDQKPTPNQQAEATPQEAPTPASSRSAQCTTPKMRPSRSISQSK